MRAGREEDDTEEDRAQSSNAPLEHSVSLPKCPPLREPNARASGATFLYSASVMTDPIQRAPLAPPAAAPLGLPQIGQVLAGKYRIEGVIGAGGMGIVVAATHLHLDERVAIKLLLPDVAQNPDTVARFMREGRAAAKIRSEHVARVFDVGMLESGNPYLVMEFLQGADLSAVIQRGPLPVAVAVDYVLQASEAIAEAHANGIVHRDLKPSNLFLTRNPDGTDCVKVLDFGISKIVTPNDLPELRMTSTSTVMGSPLYMAPEQMRSTRAVDARADIWSLGTILYELLAGRPPFQAGSLTELCLMIAEDPPAPLHVPRPDVPPRIEEAIRRCLEKAPSRRYINLGQLAEAIAPCGSPLARASATRIARVIEGASVPSLPSALATTLEPGASGALGAKSGRIGLSTSDVISAMPIPPAVTARAWAGLERRPQRRSTLRSILLGAFAISAVWATVLFADFEADRKRHAAATGAAAHAARAEDAGATDDDAATPTTAPTSSASPSRRPSPSRTPAGASAPRPKFAPL
jgi:serine/threonine protein kinase